MIRCHPLPPASFPLGAAPLHDSGDWLAAAPHELRDPLCEPVDIFDDLVPTRALEDAPESCREPTVSRQRDSG